MLTPATLVSQMIEFAADDLPNRWQEKWQAMGKSPSSQDSACTLQEWLEEVYFDEDKRSEFTKRDIAKLGELIGQLLVFEPISRAAARQILDDPWFKT